MKGIVNLKYFLVSMGSTFLILGLFCGFVIVEKNIRYVAFGENIPFFTYSINESDICVKTHFMGKDINFCMNRFSNESFRKIGLNLKLPILRHLQILD